MVPEIQRSQGTVNLVVSIVSGQQSKSKKILCSLDAHNLNDQCLLKSINLYDYQVKIL